MAIYQAQLHIKETHTHPVYGRTFNGWIAGDAINIFPGLSSACAMTSSQAIAYKCAVEKRAFEFNQAEKITSDGKPSDSTVQLEIIFDFLQ